MKTRVYLAGAINGKGDDECNAWRRAVAAALGATAEILDPMIRDYRGVEAQNVDAIVEGDLADIEASDIVLVRAEAPSWGTAMELVYARQMDKCLVGFGAGDSPSPWLVHHCDRLLPTLSAAIEYVGTLVSDDGRGDADLTRWHAGA